MTEPRMPTTLPGPVDRAEFRFVAVYAAGTTWEWGSITRWSGSKWPKWRTPRVGARDGCLTLH